MKTAILLQNVQAFLVVSARGRHVKKQWLNIKEAIAGYIAALEDDGLLVPDEQFGAMIIAV